MQYEEKTWICDDLALVGEGKTQGGEYHYLFQWQNRDENKPRTVAIAREDFGTDSGWKMLKAQGLKMTQGSGLTQRLTEHFHFNGDHFTVDYHECDRLAKWRLFIAEWGDYWHAD